MGMRQRFIVLDGRRYEWRAILQLRAAQRHKAPAQPALFDDLRKDYRPPGTRTAAERYQAPSLFTILEGGASPETA